MSAVQEANSTEWEEAIFRNVNQTIWAHMSEMPALIDILTSVLIQRVNDTLYNMTQVEYYRLHKQRLVPLSEYVRVSCDWCQTEAPWNQPITGLVQQRLLTVLNEELAENLTQVKFQFQDIYGQYVNESIIEEEPPPCCVMCPQTCPNITTPEYTETTDNMTTEQMTTEPITTDPITTESPTTPPDYTWISNVNINWTIIQDNIDNLVMNVNNIVQVIKNDIAFPLGLASSYVNELLRVVTPKCEGELDKLYDEYTDYQQRLSDLIENFKSELLKRNISYQRYLDRYEIVDLTLTDFAQAADLDVFKEYVRSQSITAESLLSDLILALNRLDDHLNNVEYWFIAQYNDSYLQEMSVYWSYFNLERPLLVNVGNINGSVGNEPMISDPSITTFWSDVTSAIGQIRTEFDQQELEVSKLFLNKRI